MSSKAPVPNPAASGTCPDWPAWVRNRRHVAGASRQTRLGLGIRHEFVWKHTPEQNGHAESFHVTLKREHVWPHGFARFQDAEVVLAKTFVGYNEDRIHYALDYLHLASLSANWMAGINEGRIHSEKSAESGIKNRGPDHNRGKWHPKDAILQINRICKRTHPP